MESKKVNVGVHIDGAFIEGLDWVELYNFADGKLPGGSACQPVPAHIVPESKHLATKTLMSEEIKAARERCENIQKYRHAYSCYELADAMLPLVTDLPSALDHVEAQAAEIERLHGMLERAMRYAAARPVSEKEYLDWQELCTQYRDYRDYAAMKMQRTNGKEDRHETLDSSRQQDEEADT